jgi:hypothetical protein
MRSRRRRRRRRRRETTKKRASVLSLRVSPPLLRFVVER